MTVSCYAISSTKNKTQIKRNAKELFGFEITNAPDMATEIGSSGPAPSAEKKKKEEVEVEVIVLIFAGTSREVEKGPKPNRTE